MRRLAHLWPIVLLACTERPLGDTAASGSSTDAPATSPATTDPGTTTNPTTSIGTTGPGTTAPGTTSTDPATSGTSSTVTTEISTTIDPSATTGIKLDFPRYMEPPPGLVGCTLAAPPGTAVTAKTMIGDFVGDRAYFGGFVINGLLGGPTLMVLSPEADAQIELDSLFMPMPGSTGRVAYMEAWDPVYDHWIGAWESTAQIFLKDLFDAVPTTWTITGFAGNWDAPDPNDPPRILGSFTGDMSGSFDAVFCDKLIQWVIAE